MDRFAAKFQIADIAKGCKDKAGALCAFAERQGFELAEICFMGDDVNDLAAMELAGLGRRARQCPSRRPVWRRCGHPGRPAAMAPSAS